MHVHKGMHVSATNLVHFYEWQSIISTGLLLNSKKSHLQGIFAWLKDVLFTWCVSIIIINHVETAQLNGKIG